MKTTCLQFMEAFKAQAEESIRSRKRPASFRGAWLLAALLAALAMAGTRAGYAQTKDGTAAAGKAGEETPGTEPAKRSEIKPHAPDVSAAKKLSRTTTLNLGAKVRGICLAGNRGFVAADGSLIILDISTPAAPKKLGSVAIAGVNMDVEVTGVTACVANRERGLVTVDVADSANPKVLGSVALQKCWTVAVKDQTAYILSLDGTFKVVDVSTPAAPKEVLAFGLPAWRPPNYHKPVTPEQEAAFIQQLKNNSGKGSSYRTDITVRGNDLVACDWVYGRIYYYDVTTPSKPVFKGTHFAPYLIQADIHGDWVFALAAYSGLSGIITVKLSDLTPDKATRYDQYPAGDYVYAGTGVDMGGIAVSESGKHVFWYGGKAGSFQVFDSTNPGHLKLVGTDTIVGHGISMPETIGLASRGDTIYVCAGSQGLAVYTFPDL